jgi:hypothetical protein
MILLKGVKENIKNLEKRDYQKRENIKQLKIEKY